MKKYCLGFCFNRNATEVLLIHKLRPAWQLHKLNGIGGKIEEGESPYAAMCREFKEETGLLVENWSHCITLEGENGNWIVFIFRAFIGQISKATSLTDEKVFRIKTKRLPVGEFGVIFNLRWMIPMLGDNLRFPITIKDLGNIG